MLELDEQEKKIVRELIKNPRLSDNQVGKATGIPIKTVNRKRKLMEEQGLLYYFVYLRHTISGTGTHTSRKFFILEFSFGITKDFLLQKLDEMHYDVQKLLDRHIHECSLVEIDGHVGMSLLMEASQDSELLDLLNGTLLPVITEIMGPNSVSKITVIPVIKDISLLHNYHFDKNMQNGKLKKDWPDDRVFVT